MPELSERLDTATLLDTGVTLAISLKTKVVTLEEAAAFCKFLQDFFAIVIQTASNVDTVDGERRAAFEIVPVIVLSSGSLDAIVHLVVKKGKELGKKAQESARHVAEHVAAIAIATFIGLHSTPIASDPSPHQVKEPPATCAAEIEPNLQELAEILSRSGKPFTIEVRTHGGKSIAVLQGNQPQNRQPPRRR